MFTSVLLNAVHATGHVMREVIAALTLKQLAVFVSHAGGVDKLFGGNSN